MSKRRGVQRPTLRGWILIAIALPLGALLWRQYLLLREVEETAAAAHRERLQGLLKGVRGRVERAYRELYLPLMTGPGDTLRGGRIDHLEPPRPLATTPGVEVWFVRAFRSDQQPAALQADFQGAILAEASLSQEQEDAIRGACFPYELKYEAGEPLGEVDLMGSERDPARPILFLPLVDGEGQVTGVSGLLLDSDYLLSEIIERAIQAEIAQRFAPSERDGLSVALLDPEGQRVGGTWPESGAEATGASNLPFLFRQYRLAVTPGERSPERMAEDRFRVHLLLLLGLALAVLVGVVFALRMLGQQWRLAQMKEDFVASVSHELRTPLASLRLFAEFLSQGKVTDPERVRDYGRRIEGESRRLSQLVDSILDLARLESGTRSASREVVPIAELVESTVEDFRLSREENAPAVHCQHEGESLLEVLLDPGAIRRALHNLLDNAVKYAPGQPIFVSLRREGHEAVVTVRDQGQGIDPGEQERVFEKFYRVSTGLVQDVPGSGLGLALVRSLVEEQGGRVSLVSRPGRGAAFHLHLPLVENPA